LKASLADPTHLLAATIGVFHVRIRPDLYLEKYAAEQEAGDAYFQCPLLSVHG
jgi:hypothetical protein